MMETVKDMNGVEINLNDKVKKHSIIGDPNSGFKEGVVTYLDSMYEGGEMMVWAGSGGAHHPKACIVIKE